ncbi:AraC family transcriptional regulator [Caulobacter mirabilis]|uniref:AraC family transcriptional regulator n=1 Tax=Caulobacter mirabilis TaxID=69666 RepID=A0A2D2B275_9CAUL|nr:helix-turn-helix domain-containing protein [Caulobacter mirabilis]ATQ44350.1 AraC family transcriptional regulator [Caulobacter mirabilis]
MTPQELDVIVRAAGATLLIWAAIRQRSAERPYFIALAACLCGFLAGNTPDSSLQLSGPLGSLAVILAGYAAVFLWWYCLAVFEAGFRPRGLVLAVGGIWIVVASVDRGLFGPALAQKGLSWGLIGLGLVMVGHLAWRLMKDRSGDLVDRRRQARLWVVAVLAAQLLADLCIDLVLGLDWQPRAFSIVQNAALLAFVAWLSSLDLARPASATTPPPPPPDADPVLVARLNQLMETDRVHLDPGLTFEAFVRAMGAPERTVRQLINQRLGYDHFRTFLNAYRVQEARRLLADPARADDKLIAIAFDSGFASLPSFNRVFRDIEGRPPSAYRQAMLAEPPSEQRSADF